MMHICNSTAGEAEIDDSWCSLAISLAKSVNSGFRDAHLKRGKKGDNKVEND